MNQNKIKDINEDLILDTKQLDVLYCMVTRSVSINAKEGDCWKLQLE